MAAVRRLLRSRSVQCRFVLVQCKFVTRVVRLTVYVLSASYSDCSLFQELPGSWYVLSVSHSGYSSLHRAKQREIQAYSVGTSTATTDPWRLCETRLLIPPHMVSTSDP